MYMEGNNENDRVVSPEIVPIHLSQLLMDIIKTKASHVSTFQPASTFYILKNSLLLKLTPL